MKTPWSNREDAIAIRLYGTIDGYQNIAEATGRSIYSVRNRCGRLIAKGLIKKVDLTFVPQSNGTGWQRGGASKVIPSILNPQIETYVDEEGRTITRLPTGYACGVWAAKSVGRAA